MSVRRTLRAEATRRADGTIDPGRAFADATARAALAGVDLGVDRISGAAIAATNGDDVELYLEGRALFETNREAAVGQWRTLTGTATNSADYSGLTNYLGTLKNEYGPNVRDNSSVLAFTLDADALDGDAVFAEPDWSWQAPNGDEQPAVLQAFNPVRSIYNSEALATGSSGIQSMQTDGTTGSYSTLVDSTAPANPLDPDAERRVHVWSSAVVGSTLRSWPGGVFYDLPVGRMFRIVVPGVRSLGGSATLVAELLYDGALIGTSDPFPVTTSWARVSLPVRLDYQKPNPTTRGVSIRFRMTARVTTPTIRFRLPHLYAGDVDRGDAAGLSVVIPGTFLNPTMHLDRGATRRINRVDLHGEAGRGAPTAFWATIYGRDGEVATAYAASPFRPSVRFPSVVTLQGRDEGSSNLYQYGRLVLQIEELDGGPGTDVWIQKIEPCLEVDLTPDLVRLSIDRTTEADPQDSTTPTGNNAAAAFTLDLNNDERQWSPYRVDFLTVGHRLEVAAGVIYTNRHNDPRGEGLDTSAWSRDLAPTPTGARGFQPLAARCGAHAGAIPGTVRSVDARMPAAPGRRIRVSGSILATGDVASLRTYLLLDGTRTVNGAVYGAERVGEWIRVTLETTIAAGDLRVPSLQAYVLTTTSSSDAGVYLADPVLEVLDAAGNPAPVVEAAPLGVGYVTAWPMDTDAATVSVRAVDALGVWGDAPAGATRVEQNVRLSDATLMVVRRVFDLAGDQVLVPPSPDVVPWLIPSDATSTTYLADLAKAEVRTIGTDGLGRFVAQARQYVEVDVSASYRPDTSAVSFATPLALDTVRNVANVTGYAVTADAELTPLGRLGRETMPDPSSWVPDSTDVLIAPGERRSFLLGLPSEAVAITDVPMTGLVGAAYRASDANGGVFPRPNVLVAAVGGTSTAPPTIPSGSPTGAIGYYLRPYATFVEVVIVGGTVPVYLAHLRVDARALRRAPVTVTKKNAASIRRYGERPADVDVPLMTTSTLLPAVADEVLESWSLVSAAGVKWLPDLEVLAMADPWREPGDRVAAIEPDSGINGEFRVVSHALDLAVGGSSSLYLRRAAIGVAFMVLDVDTWDGPTVLAI